MTIIFKRNCAGSYSVGTPNNPTRWSIDRNDEIRKWEVKRWGKGENKNTLEEFHEFNSYPQAHSHAILEVTISATDELLEETQEQ